MITVLRSTTTIKLATLALMLSSCAIVTWSFLSTVSVPMPDAPTHEPQVLAGNTKRDSQDANLTERWQGLFAMRFQRPLYDPEPKPPPAVEEKVIPPPPIRILGTMPEPSGGHATIADNNGNTYVLPVGATINAGNTTAKILKVTNDQIELEHEGRVITMKLDQS